MGIFQWLPGGPCCQAADPMPRQRRLPRLYGNASMRSQWRSRKRRKRLVLACKEGTKYIEHGGTWPIYSWSMLIYLSEWWFSIAFCSFHQRLASLLGIELIEATFWLEDFASRSCDWRDLCILNMFNWLVVLIWTHRILKISWMSLIMIIAGWWFGTFLFFHHIGNVIIPTDEVIFSEG